VRVDLHLHTRENSDGNAPAAEMIRAGIEHGLDGLVITDHHYMLTPEEQAELQAQFPDFRIFRGAEVGRGIDDVLVIGGTGEPVPELEPGDLTPLAEYAADTGAFTAYAHPFWREPQILYDLDEFCPEGIDVASMNIDTARHERILRIARERQMLPVAGSDAHNPREVGLFHLVLDDDVHDDAELVEIIRAGRYGVGTFEEMWQARREEIEPIEKLARRVIAAGGTREDFVEQGGGAGFFKRTARGGSYVPRREVIGLRPEDIGVAPRERRQ
jgi:hypothetical protein